MIGGNYFGDALVFLVQTLFGIYLLAVMLRLLLQWARADFYNPLSQFLVKITDPPLLPLRRLIPGLWGIDFAAVVLLLALQLLELAILAGIAEQNVALGGLLLLSLAKLVQLVVNVFFFSILIQVILSWVRPGEQNTFSTLIYQLNEPLLAPARRLIPPISGFDLSPILVVILLQLVSKLVVAVLADMGQAFS